MSRIPTAAREAVKARSEGRCERCNSVGTDIHHRQRRREGGHDIGNLVLLDRHCHAFVHANPAQARKDGYIVPTWVDDPAAIPFRIWTGEWVLTDDEGGFSLSRTKPE